MVKAFYKYIAKENELLRERTSYEGCLIWMAYCSGVEI